MFGTETPYSNVGPAMMGNMAAAERIPHFSDEDRGTLLKDWLNDLRIKRDNYNWTDVARLILECCKGRAGAALAVIPQQDRVRLQSVLRCLEGEFYSYANQTASGLLFNTRMLRHGETERVYATALQKASAIRLQGSATDPYREPLQRAIFSWLALSGTAVAFRPVL